MSLGYIIPATFFCFFSFGRLLVQRQRKEVPKAVAFGANGCSAIILYQSRLFEQYSYRDEWKMRQRQFHYLNNSPALLIKEIPSYRMERLSLMRDTPIGNM